MKILKFGGSSVKTADRVVKVMDIVSDTLATGQELAVVCSAFGGITDLLIDMAKLAAAGKDEYTGLFHQFTERHDTAARELLGDQYSEIVNDLTENHDTLKALLKGIQLVREISPRTMDYVLSFGERNSNFIIAQALAKRGINAQYLDARKIITTDKKFTSAKVKFDQTNKNITKYFASRKGTVQVVTGFIASAVGGLTTTLGRGGSDYTAAILAGGLRADVLEIWTDVDGVLTSDPRKVKTAFTLSELSYAEAMEMSHFGAKVIYPPTVQPALAAGIPIYIKNTFNPTFVGTRIHEKADPNFHSPIKGISSLKDMAMLTLEGSGMMGTPGISARLFSTLGTQGINVVLITQASSEHSITFAIAAKDAKQAKNSIAEEFDKEIERGTIKPPAVKKDLLVMAVIGEKMKSVPGIAGTLFESLGRNGINIMAIAQGSSELNISFVIEAHHELKALNLLHDQFFLSELKTINVFGMGLGLIGGTLLKQIHEQQAELKKDMMLQINVAGISNSRKMVFANDGIQLDNWESELTGSEMEADIEKFVEQMVSMNLPNTVFVDNTASKLVPNYYKQILDASISVVTPNKVATSSSYDSYVDLKSTAQKRGVKFLYETNVGAGLPVISTLQGLIKSGDRVDKIEAVVSGSLSYIFNNFDGAAPFSELVTKAKELGYTEPDPREDLSGADVSRKIIILARESGIALEPTDVSLKPLLPPHCMEAPDVPAFFKALATEDNHYSNLATKAAARGEVLRFVASMTGEKATISLQSVGPDSPFYSLQDSDNMIVITTKRYHTTPLVIRGPGAGAEVTAGGVFADIISIGG